MIRSYLSLFVMEIKKTLSYRVDFWVNLAASLFAEMLVQWCLWTAVYSARDTATINGWSLYGMIFYCVMIFFVRRIVIGRLFGLMSDDIYTGGLNRYLVSPLDFIVAKYVSHLAYALTVTIQFVAGIGLYTLLFPWPEDVHLSLWGTGGGFVALCLASVLHYLITAALDMAAFWIDNTWTLIVMWRWIAGLFGGTMFPINLFPHAFAQALELTPFPYLFAFPLEIFLGRVSLDQWFFGIIVAAMWIVAFACLARVIYRAGLRVYSGVGI